MLIDAGDKGKVSQDPFKHQLQQLVPGASPNRTATIDVLVASHPHEDHVAGIKWVLENYRVKKFFDNGKPYTPTYADIVTLVTAQSNLVSKKVKYFRIANDSVAVLTKADFCPRTDVNSWILVPKGFGHAPNKNNNSVIVLVKFGETKLLFTGDAEKELEKQLLETEATKAKLSGARFYKVGHHGAEKSSTAPLLAELQLQGAGASSGCKKEGKNKGHRHPRDSVLRRLTGALPASPAGAMRTVHSGQAATDKWTITRIPPTLAVTPLDGPVLFVSDGTQVRHADAQIDPGRAACPQPN